MITASRVLLSLVFGSMLSLLSGCAAEDTGDLQRFMDETRQRPKGKIEPLPKLTPHEIFNYNASDLRSPFQPLLRNDLAKYKNIKVKPDENRPRQFLEGFDLDDFNMVGTLSNKTGIQALLKGPAGINRVKTGDYIGRNHGRITAITQGKIELLEIVPDGDGTWSERPQTLMLKERS